MLNLRLSATDIHFHIIQLSRSFQLSSNSQTPLSLPTEAGEGVLKTSYRVLVHDQGRPYLTCKRTQEFGLYQLENTFAAAYGCKVPTFVGSFTPDPAPLRASPFHLARKGPDQDIQVVSRRIRHHLDKASRRQTSVIYCR